MIIQLDLEAYDCVNWTILDTILERFGFNASVRSMLSACYRSGGILLLIDGRSTNFFQPTRGLRQGDPVSPYLFILYMEPFIINLKEKVQQEHLTPTMKVSANITAPIALLYADDIILFIHGSSDMARRLRRFLLKFEVQKPLAQEEKCCLYWLGAFLSQCSCY